MHNATLKTWGDGRPVENTYNCFFDMGIPSGDVSHVNMLLVIAGYGSANAGPLRVFIGNSSTDGQICYANMPNEPIDYETGWVVMDGSACQLVVYNSVKTGSCTNCVDATDGLLVLKGYLTDN
jgi:hypothetical protein